MVIKSCDFVDKNVAVLILYLLQQSQVTTIEFKY